MTTQTIVINGVPSDLGANIQGSNMGPAAIRIAGLKSKIEGIGYNVTDNGDLPVPVRDSLSESVAKSCYFKPILSLCSELSQLTYKSSQDGHIPLTIGGDHSIAIGSISGVSKSLAERNQSLGVIWVDAHADINTPGSTESGNIHGMPLATLIGDGHEELVNIGGKGPSLDPKNVALVGIRTIDKVEKEILKKSGINYYTMRDIDERGMAEVMKEAINVTTRNTDSLHLSFDIDGIDPLYAPGVSTPVTGGLSFREAHLLLEMIAETDKLGSMDFVELNPYTDVGSTSSDLTVELILSALGKSIV